MGREEAEAGDSVIVRRLGEEPVLVESRKGKQLTVAYGGLTMKVKAAEVARVIKAERVVPPPKAAGRKGGKRERRVTAVRVPSNTLDLRGKRLNEVGDDVAHALDRAMDLGCLYIITGRGTGQMRRFVRERLAEDPLVARFEDAPEPEGGNGCTIVYLR